MLEVTVSIEEVQRLGAGGLRALFALISVVQAVGVIGQEILIDYANIGAHTNALRESSSLA